MEFKDKIVFITGASGGMGEEITKILAKKHCKLGLFARRENKLQQLVKECGLDAKCQSSGR